MSDKCCPHRAADHEQTAAGSSTAKVGSKCTVPGCDCKGWKARGSSGVGVRGESVKIPAKPPSPNRRGARIFVNGAGPYPTEWVKGVHRFRPNPIVEELLDLQRGDDVLEELEAKGWSADTKIIDRGESVLSLEHVREIYRLAGVSLDDYRRAFPDDTIRYRVTSAGVR